METSDLSESSETSELSECLENRNYWKSDRKNRNLPNSGYSNLPNKGARRSSKDRSDRLREKLRFSAFKLWFRIENRTIIKETMSIYFGYLSQHRVFLVLAQ